MDIEPWQMPSISYFRESTTPSGWNWCV